MTQQQRPKNMASIAAERFGQQHPPRPPLESQHSSSVPSTPFQRPRDMRFHSRSPSPHRGLSSQSPASVVSESIGDQRPAQRTHSGPVVCRFETGAEIRKRRMPYLADGHLELPPPSKEPKKMLDPDEDEKLSGDMRELYDRLLPSDESEERRAKLIQKLSRILNEEWPGNDITVNVFGSSGNLLASSDSDVDICITTSYKKMESMHDLARLLSKNGMEKVECRASAKVPIVKIWDPELRLACDMNINNPMALENTRMIKTYVQIDPRVRPLAKIIKYWTKRRILNDAAFGGTISSYTWICMIISFLQRRNPPILPSLQKLDGYRLESEDSMVSSFADDLESLKGYGDANKESLAELLFQFFRHYGYEFIYSEFVVSIREGQLLSRKQKGWSTTNYTDKEARNRLCVEEPFTISRNLGNSADDYSWSGIHNEIRRAFGLLADGCQLEECCKEFEFPLEEKPIFVRPTPKPAPILRRSASQSGRPNHEQGSGRLHNKKNRNQSAHRSSNNNRRASSGASYTNHRAPHGFVSPVIGPQQLSEFFATKGSIHDQLFQQYQFLQVQQDALRSQLAHHAHQLQGQSHGQASPNIGASQRHHGFNNGVASPNYVENAPQTAPLLPGYLYHFPARYPPPSSMSQARSREGTNTNPSSPSLGTAVPAMRRQGHRTSITNGSPGAIRSQSQPGRSLPHPLTLHQQVHPGFDITGALPAQYQHLRASQGYMTGMPLTMSPLGGIPGIGSRDNAMPKEYLGYYVGHSPQFGPQSQYSISGQSPMPSMLLRDPPSQRPRRVTPDLASSHGNGSRTSRSPSLGHQRSFPTLAERRTTQSQLMVNMNDAEVPTPILEAAPPPIDIGGPLIVNGSNPSFGNEPAYSTNGVSGKDALPNRSQNLSEASLSRVRSLSIRTSEPSISGRVEATNGTDTVSSSRVVSPGSTPKLSDSTVASNGHAEAMSGQFAEPPPLSAPLLSPVAEMRTPSPTQIGAFDKLDYKLDSPIQSNGHILSKLRTVDHRQDENSPSPINHERKGSAPNPAQYGKLANGSVALTQSAGANGQNGWQQATRKGHKKSKSNVGSKAPLGKAMPTNESERKGG